MASSFLSLLPLSHCIPMSLKVHWFWKIPLLHLSLHLPLPLAQDLAQRGAQPKVTKH